MQPQLLDRKVHIAIFIVIVVCMGLAGSLVAILAVIGFGEDIDAETNADRTFVIVPEDATTTSPTSEDVATTSTEQN